MLAPVVMLLERFHVKKNRWVNPHLWPTRKAGEEPGDWRVDYSYAEMLAEDVELFLMLSGYRRTPNDKKFLEIDFESCGGPLVTKPRGLPEDVSRDIRMDVKKWNDWSGTLSWISAEEVLAFDWSKFKERYPTSLVTPFLRQVEKLTPAREWRIIIFLSSRQ